MVANLLEVNYVKWKPLFAVLLGLLMAGVMAGSALSAKVTRSYLDSVGIASYENQKSIAKLHDFLNNNLSVPVSYFDLLAIQRITPEDTKQVKELKTLGLTASESSILRFIKKIQLMEFVASRSGGDPEVIIKLAQFLGDRVVPIKKPPIQPMSGDYNDLLLDVGGAHFYQNDPEMPYYVMIWGNYLWKELEGTLYRGPDDVVYYKWDEADDLILFKDVYASPEMRRAGSDLGAIAYYTPDSLHSGYVRLYFVPKTPSVSGRWTRVSMTYVHTFGIGGDLSVTVGYKYMLVLVIKHIWEMNGKNLVTYRLK
ncbi:hypothetical protein [Thermococcus sp.]|uniref:hypothetical protein n=1 Tax=Thermococcus sp. TaxID=35749 RepID=UPI0026097C2C|nr:hypothetical protein [Thermococcus sp.]